MSIKTALEPIWKTVVSGVGMGIVVGLGAANAALADNSITRQEAVGIASQAVVAVLTTWGVYKVENRDGNILKVNLKDLHEE